MDTRQAYNVWAEQYDSNINRTRDLEALSLRSTLGPVSFDSCLEIGCGTGKNTIWFIEKASHVTAVDLSEEMLARARQKITSEKVMFKQADIISSWTFTDAVYDLISFSLVLEHIENLDHIFRESAKLLKPGGYIYIGELHPFKQYAGSKARFETEQGLQVVECFNHHVSDFIQSARKHGLAPVDINEYFDDNDRGGMPRILTMLLRKTGPGLGD
jgi:ubiquinone/menaquinone biosynthesis C-methylase UbiE